MYTYPDRFEWDEVKRISNLEKHGLDFGDAPLIFEGVHVKLAGRRHGSEERRLAVGRLGDRIATVVFTRRSESIRVISFRWARDTEKRKHQELYGS